MKSTAIALGLVIALATAGTASASYRLSPSASQEERQQYEAQHTMLNQYHPENARGAMTSPEARSRNARSPGGALNQSFPESERNWFKQSSGEQYEGCAVEVSRPC